MKKFKNVFDGLRSSVTISNNQPSSSSTEKTSEAYQVYQENLRADYFNISKTFCHGFPFQPTAIAFDPVQKLIAIGTQCGSLRILGRPGVDIPASRRDLHLETISPPAAILHLEFLCNEGKLVSVTSDDVLHLWNFRENTKPEIIHSLKFQRERITVLRIPLQAKWIYIGTERGNIHVVNVDTCLLSGYVINWNKAIELSRKTHPGSVVFLGDCPTDPSKLLIAYDSGQIVLWDLRQKAAELRYQSNEPLRSLAWHSDGKSFVSSHSDGSLVTWNIRNPTARPVSVSFPHARGITKEGKVETFRPIQKVDWKSSRTGENFVIFSGGLPTNGASSEHGSNTPSLTVIHGKTTTVLEMEHNVLDFIVICESQFESEIQDPTGIIVLLQSDLVIIDLLTPGYPSYPNPYPMDIHESPVTTCVYIANCPGDLIPAFYSVGSKVNKKSSGYSDREWPVNGGTWGTSSCSYAEIIITGHADGSVKFWDASSTSLQALYKLKTSKPFERQQSKKIDESDPYAVQLIKICPESRFLAVAGASSQVLLFKFRKHETAGETAVLEIPIVSELVEDEFGGFDYSMRVDRDKLEFFSPLRIKSGQIKKSPGYQIELVCCTPWVNGDPPGGICSLAISSGLGLLAYGTENGVVIVDYIQQVCLLSNATPDLYGTADPYTRQPKSPSSLKRDESPPDSQQSFDCVEKTCASTPSGETVEQSQLQSLQLTQEEVQLPLPLPKSPRTSWSNVKAMLSKGFQKKSSAISESGVLLAVESESLKPHEPLKSTCSESNVPVKNKNECKFLEVEPEECKFLKVNELPLPVTSPEIVNSGVNYNPSTMSSTTKSPDQELPLSERETPTNNYNDTVAEDLRLNRRQLTEQQQQQIDSEFIDIMETTEDDLDYAHSNIFATHYQSHEGMEAGNELPLNKLDRPKDLPLAPIPPPRHLKAAKKKSKVIDLRTNSNSNSLMTSVIRKIRINKLDSTFSRSRSSSMSSLDNITSESIQCLTFVETFPKKNDPTTSMPTIWVGTSLGSILVLNIGSTGSDRQNDPLTVTPSGTIFRLKGSILEMCFMDANGILIGGSTESWRDEARAKTPTKTSSRGSPTSDPPQSGNCPLHYAILVSEKQSRVVSLPSQSCLYKAQLVNSNNLAGEHHPTASASVSYFVIRAGVTTIKDSPCLVTYNSNGRLSVYSLPSLRILIDADFVPLSDLSFLLSSGVLGGSGSGGTRKIGLVDPMLRIAKTFCFSELGHGLYLSSPSEVQKFTISAEFSHTMDSMLGSLFIEQEFPERPKEGFFTGLFGGGVRNLDREELFGEASGKPPRSVAKLIGPSTPPELAHLNMRSSTAASEVARAKMLLVERGEKLGQLEDKTAKMSADAENFSSAAHQLMLKYKDKKWYQL